MLGGFLQKIGRRVTYVGRGEHFRAIQEKGLMITGIWGDHFVPPEEIDALPGTGFRERNIRPYYSA